MDHNALQRGDLRASFEPYSNLVRGVIASLSLKNCILVTRFFFQVDITSTESANTTTEAVITTMKAAAATIITTTGVEGKKKSL